MYHFFLDITLIFLSLLDLLHSIWPYLGSSMWLPMVLFYSFYGWAIFHCIYVPHLFDPFYQWIFRLLPCLGHCKQCCNEHWSACTLSDHVFLPYMTRSRIANSYGISIFSFFLWNFLIVLHIGWGKWKWSFLVVIYFPINSREGFPSIHTLSSIYCLWIFW